MEKKMIRTKPIQKANQTLDEMIGQVVLNKVESYVAKLLVKSRNEANRNKAKLNEVPQLPHLIADEEAVEVEYEESDNIEGGSVCFKKRS